MTVPALVPMLRVMNVARSIAFYESLGFTVVSTEGEPEPFWANVCASGNSAAAELMLSREETSGAPRGVVLYYHVADVRRLRDRLAGLQVNPSEMTFPPYASAGEFTLTDPDGHQLMIGQVD